MKKKILCIFLTFALLLGVPVFSEAASSSGELWMKIGIAHILSAGERDECDPKDPTVTPICVGDTVLVPVAPVARFAGAFLVENDGDVSLTLHGEKLSIKDLFYRGTTLYGERKTVAALFGLETYYDPDMKLLAFGKKPFDIRGTSDDWSRIFEITTKFLFDLPSADKVAEDFDSNVSGTHPFIMTSQEKFDELRTVYENSATDPSLILKTLTALVNEAERNVNVNFTTGEDGHLKIQPAVEKSMTRNPYLCYDENGEPIIPLKNESGFVDNRLDPLKSDPLRSFVWDPETNIATYTLKDEEGNVVYTDSCRNGDGADDWTRLNEISALTAPLPGYAFAWQMTGDRKYAEAFWLTAEAVGKWPTWGESHHLDCADSGAYFTLGYDWIYHAFDAEPEKQAYLANVLYERVVLPGYYCTAEVFNADYVDAYRSCFVTRRTAGTFTYWYTYTNWNPVCTSGSVMAALAVMDIPEYREKAKVAISSNLSTVPNMFLAYIPDGSHSEGVGYWGYATCSFFRMIGAMMTTLGDDYGLMDAVGMDLTCYYAYYVAANSGIPWNFHDSEPVPMDHSFYYFVSAFYNNPDFAYMRNSALQTETGNVYDAIYYDASLAKGGTAPASLDRFLRGMETVTMRSSFEKGGSFIGLHAGATVSAHSDMDAGTVFLEMGGVRWFYDYGSDSYSNDGYFTSDIRYYYYHKSPECHSTVTILSDRVPYGQMLTTPSEDHATISRFYSTADGALAVADMAGQYGPTALSATRALLFTNSRQTAVVQDEIFFSEPTSLCWVASCGGVSAGIADGGKTAYLQYGGKKLRMTLLSSDPTLSFSIVPAGTTILPGTRTRSEAYPYASYSQQRVVIRAENVTRFDVAVVCELYLGAGQPVCYQKVPISNMQPLNSSLFPSFKPQKDDTGENEPTRPTFKYKGSDLVRALTNAQKSVPETTEEWLALSAKLIEISSGMDPNDAASIRAAAMMTEFYEEHPKERDDVNSVIRKIEKLRKKAPLPI